MATAFYTSSALALPIKHALATKLHIPTLVAPLPRHVGSYASPADARHNLVRRAILFRSAMLTRDNPLSAHVFIIIILVLPFFLISTVFFTHFLDFPLVQEIIAEPFITCPKFALRRVFTLTALPHFCISTSIDCTITS